MTGYELLITELQKDFNINKINSNGPLIEAVVKILAEDSESKIALSLAEEELKTAKRIRNEARSKMTEAENLFHRANSISHENNSQSIRLHQNESALKELEERLNELETPEARDKMRLAHYYETHAHADGTTLARGLSNILGNGGAKKMEIKDE